MKDLCFGDEDKPGGPVQEPLYQYKIASPVLMESMFAASFVKNLALASKTFRVKTAARNLCINIVSGRKEDAEKFRDFLEELEKSVLTGNKSLSSSGMRMLEQRDFEQMLALCKSSSAKNIQDFFANRIKVSPKKREVVPRTPNQLAYTKSIREKDMVFGIGPAGTGKTYLAMALAVSELLAGNFNRIILTRPAVEAGENLGFLPGKLEEKINPYLRPLYDALYDMLDFEEANTFLERGIIEVAPLAFMRGRTLSDSFIILDEAQNTTREQMLMLLTRIGFKSKCVIAGDPSQIDLPSKGASGLSEAMRRLAPIEEIAICRFSTEDVLRHTLVEKIIEAYRKPVQEDTENNADKKEEENPSSGMENAEMENKAAPVPVSKKVSRKKGTAVSSVRERTKK